MKTINKKIRIKPYLLYSFLVLSITFHSCKESEKPQNLNKEQITQLHQFVDDLNKSFKNFDYDFLEEAWSHQLFKRQMGNLDYIGRSVFEHIYETSIKSLVNNRNSRLINEVRHSGAVLKHINTNIQENFAEVTYLLIEKHTYSFTKYKIDFSDNKPYLTDIYGYRENRWYSKAMYESVLLNVKYDAFSRNRHEANQALDAYQVAMENGEYDYAFDLLNQVPESHQAFNDFKLAKVMLGAQFNDSIFSSTVNELKEEDRNIYLDYVIAYYMNDSIYQHDIRVNMQREIGISKLLVDSLENSKLVWE